MNEEQPITAAELGQLLAELEPIGRSAQDGSTTRLAWSDEDEQARGWFERRASELGRAVERDPAGNLWALPSSEGPWWGLGSHLDTVVQGGRFDGALGVAAAFAVAARISRVAVLSFADEEGARFNTPTFGSRILAGRLDPSTLLERSDTEGVTLADALRSAGLDPRGLAEARAWQERLRGFLELHIDQTQELSGAGRAAGVVSGLAARMRLQVRIVGRADHAGTTRGSERHDALSAAARLIVGAEDLAREAGEMVFTASRIEVEPNASSTVASLVRLWLDARGPAPETIEAWRSRLEQLVAEVAGARGVQIELATASWSPGGVFDGDLRAALGRGLQMASAVAAGPELLCWAGHDAGVLGTVLPTAMILVANPSGISHAPEEEVSLEDAAVGANAMLAAMRSLH